MQLTILYLRKKLVYLLHDQTAESPLTFVARIVFFVDCMLISKIYMLLVNFGRTEGAIQSHFNNLVSMAMRFNSFWVYYSIEFH